MAQVRMGSIAMRPEATRKCAQKPEPMMGPKATTPRMGKRMTRADSSQPHPLRRKALRNTQNPAAKTSTAAALKAAELVFSFIPSLLRLGPE